MKSWMPEEEKDWYDCAGWQKASQGYDYMKISLYLVEAES